MSIPVQIALWTAAVAATAALFMLWLEVGPAVLISGIVALCS